MFKFLRRSERPKTEQAVRKAREAWFGRMAALLHRSHFDQDLWDDLEELLISADVGVSTAERLLGRLRERVREERIGGPEQLIDALKQEMVDILDVDGAHMSSDSAEPPHVLLMVGVNGVGKTTSIAKLANLYQNEGKIVLLGAADTFRAAAIEQLQAWGLRLGVEVIAHRPGADPGAVAFDTVQAARSRGADVVIIDTAGRLHTKLNLMEELKKVQRVISSHGGIDSQRVILTMDATTGQNGLLQARSFIEAVRCDGVFLAKLDGTAKGGIVMAITEELKLPILYIGTGEQPDDMSSFEATEFVEGLFTSLETG